jgi:hypothetical protein
MHDYVRATEVSQCPASGIVGWIIADDDGRFRSARTGCHGLGHRELKRTDR